MKPDSQTTNFIGMMNERNHVVELEVPPVKILGVTVRKGYTATKFVPCECGTSARERLIESMNRPNLLFKKLMEKANVKTN